MTEREIITAARRSPLLFDLSEDALSRFAATAGVRRLDTGETIFRIGEVGHEFFVVASGDVEIVVPTKPGREEVISCLGPGAWFGEVALLTGEGRSATARAARDTELLVIGREHLAGLLEASPALALRLSNELSRRLRQNSIRRCAAKTPRVIVIEDAAAGDGDEAAAGALAAEISLELGREVTFFGSHDGVALTPQIRRRDPGSAAEIAAAAANERVAVVRLRGQSAGAPEIYALPCARVSLNEVTAAARASTGTSPYGLMTSPLRRLTRRLLARSVALILGAGGAKGFCHIGAIQAFERAGIQFDMIVGTSIGVLIGGFAARPATGEELFLGFRDVARDFRRMVVDFRLFGPSLLRGRKKTSIIEENTLGRNLEDLPIAFHAVAADLVSARETVLSTGPLSQAIDAATAVPTIFPPVVVGAKRLVDGWMVNPIPADVAIAEGATRIVAIDPSAAERGAGIGANGRRPRGIVARLAKTFDVGARVRVAMRAMDVSARDRALAAKSLVDVCVEPPLARYASTAIGDYDRIVEIGDKAATEAVPRIRDVLRQEAFA